MKTIKELLTGALWVVIGLPLLAAGFMLLALGTMALLFGIPFALMSSTIPVVHTIGVVWTACSVFGFFGFILIQMG